MAIFSMLFTLLTLSIKSDCFAWIDHPLCGLHRATALTTDGARVFNGSSPYRGQLPWVVYIRFGNTVADIQSCTGGIIKESWVLTAAHCLKAAQGLYLQMTYDRIRPSDKTTGGTRKLKRGVNNKNIFIHPRYRPGRFDYDIGLIYVGSIEPFILPTTVDEIQGVNRLCLLPPTPFTYRTGEIIHAAGHGLKVENYQGDDQSDLTNATFRIQDVHECSTLINYNEERQFCFYGTRPRNSQLCVGDSGAPVTFYYPVVERGLSDEISDQRAYAIGVESNGEDPCGGPPFLGPREVRLDVAVKVSAFTDWIQETIDSVETRQTKWWHCLSGCHG